MEQWIKERLNLYINIYTKYAESEVAISHCALSMAKILNGLAEMSYTQFHKYEKKMLWSAIELFSEQCIEQIKYALASEDVTEKKEVISDIENSISQIMEVCKNIFDGTANAERQMFQSLSVDANLYELSPKLCAFYASILEKTVALFAETEQKYAFVIHPTLRSTIEAKILFKTRKESGRVVIVYISESVIEEFKLVPICLMHEAFHVITKRERYRQERAKYFVLHMISYIEKYLFQNVVISDDNKQNGEIRKKMLENIFRDTAMLGKSFGNDPEDSKRFYSKNIKQEICKTIKKELICLTGNLEDIVFEHVCGENGRKGYASFQQDISRAKKITEQMRYNLNSIIENNTVSITADLLMSIYQETYADIACILTLDLTPEQYSGAFARSIQFDYDEEKYLDTDKVVREYLVAQTMIDIMPENKKEKWKNYLQETQKYLQKNEEKHKESYRQGNNYYDMIKITVEAQALSISRDYLRKCAKSLLERLWDIQNLESFQGFVKKVMRGRSSELLLDILSQTVNL